MASLFRRMTNIFSSSAPTTIKVEEKDGEQVNEDTKERDEAEGSDILECKEVHGGEGEVAVDMKDFNGLREQAGEVEGGEVELSAKKTKAKTDKKASKGRKISRNTQAVLEEEEEEEELRDAEMIDVDDILAPKRRSGEDAQMPAIGIEDATELEERPISKRAKKINGGKKPRKPKEVDARAEEHAEPAPELAEDNPAVVANTLNAASKRKKAEKVFKPALTPQVVIIPRARPTLMSVTNPVEAQLEVLQNDIIPDELAELPKRIKKAKKKLKGSKKVVSEEYAATDEEAQDDSTAILRQPLTPATTNHTHGRDFLQEEESFDIQSQVQIEVQSSAHAEHAEGDGPLKQPSKRASGKRKASAEMVKPVKKRKQLRDQGTPNADIRKFGTTLPPQPATASQQSRSEPQKSQDIPTNSLEQMKEENSRLFAPAAPPATVQGLGMDLLRYGRRGTPQFTPINKKYFPERSISINRDAVASNNRYDLSTTSAEVERVTSELAWPEDQAQDLEEPEEPEPRQLLTTRLEVQLPSFGSSASKAPSVIQPTVADPEPEYLESNADFNPSEDLGPGEEPNPPVPSSVRRKRRLPTDERLESQKRPAMKTPARARSAPKTPAATKSTPRPRATPMTGGKGLTNDEVDEITEAVESYQLQNEIEQFALNALVQTSAQAGSDNLKEFWNQVCGQVPDIPRLKVMNFCRRKYHNFIRGSWSEEQDDELRYAYERHPGKWKTISEIINRFPEDARLRWRDYLVCGTNQKKDVWDKEEEERLKDAVQECLDKLRESTKISTDARYKNADEGSQIDWQKVSGLMDHTRSRLQCMSKWKSLKEREDTDSENTTILAPIGETKWRVSTAAGVAHAMAPNEKIRLLRAIRDSAAGREGKIPWRTIAEELDKKGKRMALKVCFRNLRINVPGHKEMKLQDIVSFLIDAFRAASPNEPPGFEKEDIRVIMTPQPKNKSKRKRVSDDQASSKVNGEGSGTEGRRKLPRSLRVKSEKFVVEDPLDDGEGPSTRKSTKLSNTKSKRNVDTNLDEENDFETLVPKKRKTTIRERVGNMNNGGDFASQETAQVTDDDDIGTELRTAWASFHTTPRAKPPLMRAKTSQRKQLRPIDDEVPATSSPPPVIEDPVDVADNDIPQSYEDDGAVPAADSPQEAEDDHDALMDDLVSEPREDESASLSEDRLSLEDEKVLPNSFVNSQAEKDDGDKEDEQISVNGHSPQSYDEADDKPLANGFIDSQAEEDESASSSEDHSDLEEDDSSLGNNLISPQAHDGAEASVKRSFSPWSVDEDVKINGHTAQDDDSDEEIDDDPFADFTAPSYTAPGGPKAYDSFEDSDDEFRQSMYREEDDFDADDEHNITMNGFHREESVDLDLPANNQSHRSNSNQLGSLFGKELNGVLRSPSVSSDDTHSSIPAVAYKDVKIEQRSILEGSPLLGE